MPAALPDPRPSTDRLDQPDQPARSAWPDRASQADQPPPGTRLVVAAAVMDSLCSPTEMLCAARSYPPGLAGRFELPGGKVEPGETPTQALARELVEEVGLTVRLGTELVAPGAVSAVGAGEHTGSGTLTWRVSGGLSMRVWLAEPDRPGERGHLGADHQELRWVRLGELTRLPWLEADVAIIEALMTRLDVT